MKLLIIGFGSIARKHLAALREIEPEAEVHAIRSSSSHEPIQGVTSIVSLEQLRDQPDFVIISNPSVLHGASIREASMLGCPLFIEKPLLSDLSQADGILELVREKNLLTYTACNLRFHPVIQFLKRHLADHPCRVNEVNIYCGSHLPDWRPGKDYRAVYSSREEMGGGVHLDLIHEIDYCTWLFGMPASSECLRTRRSSLDIPATDFASYRLLYPGFTASITLNYYRRDPKREIEIVGDSATVAADLLACTVRSSDGRGILFQSETDMSHTYSAQMRYFLDHLRSGRQPMNSVDEAIEVLRIALHGQPH
jgi:predicted dehydrogenase